VPRIVSHVTNLVSAVILKGDRRSAIGDRLSVIALNGYAEC